MHQNLARSCSIDVVNDAATEDQNNKLRVCVAVILIKKHLTPFFTLSIFYPSSRERERESMCVLCVCVCVCVCACVFQTSFGRLHKSTVTKESDREIVFNLDPCSRSFLKFSSKNMPASSYNVPTAILTVEYVALFLNRLPTPSSQVLVSSFS